MSGLGGAFVIRRYSVQQGTQELGHRTLGAAPWHQGKLWLRLGRLLFLPRMILQLGHH